MTELIQYETANAGTLCVPSRDTSVNRWSMKCPRAVVCCAKSVAASRCDTLCRGRLLSVRFDGILPVGDPLVVTIKSQIAWLESVRHRDGYLLQQYS